MEAKYWMVGLLALLLGACVDKSVQGDEGQPEKVALPYTIVAPGTLPPDGNSMAIYSLFLEGEDGLHELVADSSVDCKAAMRSSLTAERLASLVQADEGLSLDSRWRTVSELELLGMQAMADSLCSERLDLKPLLLTDEHDYAYAVRRPQAQEASWLGVKESFPGYSSIVSFGRIVYSSQQDLALLFVDQYGNSLASSERIYLLEKKEGEWVVSTSWLLTIS